MDYLQFIRRAALCCAAIVLTACGGEDKDAPATTAPLSDTSIAPDAPSPPGTFGTPASSVSPDAAGAPPAPDTPRAPTEPGAASMQPAAVPDTTGDHPRTMAGFPNLGATCFANSAWKFLIHSAEPQRLKKHLIGEVASGDALHREAAMHFIELIESSYSETGPAPADLMNLLASLQKLPAFSMRNAAGTLEFALGDGQDASEFLMRLSESFSLQQLYGHAIALHDDNNAFKTDEEYWTILRPASAHDSLQDVFDRIKPEDWRVTPGENLRQLTVRIEDAVEDEEGRHLLGSRNFDFNATVRLKATDAITHRPLVITLAPREVMEYVPGHYLIHAKDGLWFRHNDSRVQALERMPAIEQVRFINFAVVKVEPAS